MKPVLKARLTEAGVGALGGTLLGAIGGHVLHDKYDPLPQKERARVTAAISGATAVPLSLLSSSARRAAITALEKQTLQENIGNFLEGLVAIKQKNSALYERLLKTKPPPDLREVDRILRKVKASSDLLEADRKSLTNLLEVAKNEREISPWGGWTKGRLEKQPSGHIIWNNDTDKTHLGQIDRFYKARAKKYNLPPFVNPEDTNPGESYYEAFLTKQSYQSELEKLCQTNPF